MPLTTPHWQSLQAYGDECHGAAGAPAEQSLRENAARLRLALAIAGLGAWEYECAAGRKTWNDVAAALLHVPPDRIAEHGGGWLDFVHPHDRERVQNAMLNTAWTGTPFAEEFRVRRLDGAERTFISRGVLAGPGRVVGVVQDVTEIRLAQAGLAESEARLRVLANIVPQMIWTAQPDGYVDWRNERWYEYTALPPEQGGEAAWTPILHPEDAARTVAAWRHAVSTGERYEIEYRLRRHDGVFRWHVGRAVPQRNEAGSIIRWFGTCIDIDDQKRAEEVLLHNRADLERLIAERTQALQDTQARLAQSQRVEALGQLAGGIAHDFNNVLQTIEAGAVLIERHADDAGKVLRHARAIAGAVARGTTVTRRLLAFSRRGDLRAEPVDPYALLTGMREILAHTLGAGVEIRLDVSAGLPVALADKGQLETVLVNLATNARDAMAGKGVLSLSAAPDILREHAAPGYPPVLRVGRYLCLSVTDTGAGMDAATLARASEPFFTTKPPGTGTGLGLAMARGFAEQSGGGLQIDSMPGRGTTVRLWLPLVDPVAAAPAPADGEAPDAAAQAPSCRLMLVDDDEAVLESLAEQITALGYAVLPAHSAAEALAQFDAGQAVDLIVSDLSMPDMDGMTLIGEAQRRRPALPAVLLTGFATDAADIAARDTPGAVALLHKPIRASVLAGLVEEMLRRGPAPA